MQDAPAYSDVVAEVGDFLVERIARAHATPGSPTARCASIPGFGFGKTRRAQPHAAGATRRAGRACRRAGARRHVTQVVHPRGARRRRAAHATTARSPPWCGRSIMARGSCACTTPLRRATRCGCSTSCRNSTPRRSREGSLGTGARTPRVLLDHQGPPRRVGAPGRLRAQPPEGAPPGGADLAHRPRLHPHPLDARLAPQPARVRGSRHPLRPRADRAPRRVERAPARALQDALAGGSPTPRSGC